MGSTLVARFQQRILARIAHHQPGHSPHQQIVKPGRVGSFFEGDLEGAALSGDEIQNRRCLRGYHRLHHQPALGIQHGYGNGGLVDIESNVLHTVHGCSFPLP